ncbi:hypothetical protein Fmac_026741 [Flemingia macrophylla]|uniref:GHMP kinase N-terminal domain-containing protein n=1 Tax=Flemingia macrophylla TaxID=520843 RepID=A0ABD1LFP0_9FABA
MAFDFLRLVSRVKGAFPDQLSSMPTRALSRTPKQSPLLSTTLAYRRPKSDSLPTSPPSSSCTLLFNGLNSLSYKSVLFSTFGFRFKPATMVVTSELPLGMGLSSLASFCVALASALLACTDSVSLDVIWVWD